MDGAMAGWAGAGLMLLVNIGTVCYAFGRLENEAKNNSKSNARAHERIDELEKRQRPCPELTELKERIAGCIAEIKNDLSWIKQKLGGER